MARIDGMLVRVFAGNARCELIFQTNAAPTLRSSAGNAPLLKQVLSTSQVVSALSETVPAELLAKFPMEGLSRWPYLSPAGPVLIQFEKRLERVRATLRPTTTEKVAEEFGDRFTPPEGLRIMADGPAMLIPTRDGAKAAQAAPEEANKPAPVALQLVSEPEPITAQVMPQVPAEAMSFLLQTMLDRRASDLHLSTGNPPRFRIDGDMTSAAFAALTNDALKELLWTITPEVNRQQWESNRDTDFAHEIADARFRVNIFKDRKGIGAVFRHIPSVIRSAEDMGLSPAILDLCKLSKGLVLVTGPTGSGKSTTLAAMIDYINTTRDDHIITIEDPVEFVHPSKRCLINQREVGPDTNTFKQALRAALREDPDVVLVGELRDLETVAMAIETAETGHLVFGTLHTNTAASTVDRLVDQFPSDRQEQVRTMLSESLKGVVSQTLCKKIGGGRVAAQEVLLGTNSVANLIREKKTFQLGSVMQTGRSQGMCMLNDALFELVKKNLVEPQEALAKSVARAEMKALLERSGFKLEAPGPVPGPVEVPAAASAAPANKPLVLRKTGT
jgi:twitching motility protein PilT